MFVHTVFCFKSGTFDCIVFIDNVDFWAQSPNDRMKVVSVFTGYKKIELYFCANIYLNYGGNSLTFTMILVLTVDTYYFKEEKNNKLCILQQYRKEGHFQNTPTRKTLKPNKNRFFRLLIWLFPFKP